MNVLVTGGAGYIGSHAVRRLLRDGHAVVVLDNLCRGHAEAVDALSARGTAAGNADAGVTLIKRDLRDTGAITEALKHHGIDCVMNFAALAYVCESVTEPLLYYENNTAGVLSLLRAMDTAGVKKMVHSSTCATYGEPPEDCIPIPENCPQQPINPYGWSKLFVERVLIDYANANDDFAFAALRYFNVAGSASDGTIGEDHDPETHLIPVLLNTALGKRESATIFGTDYPTPDGTCIRDYIHVEDLVDAHARVMEKLSPGDQRFYNLGTGQGLSVRQIVDAVKAVTGVDFEVKVGERRPGDPPVLYADPSKIQSELGWSAQVRDAQTMVEHAWGWFKRHPAGYGGEAVKG